MEEETVFVKAACQNYEVLVEVMRIGKFGGIGPLRRYETRIRPKGSNGGLAGSQEITKEKFPSFQLSSEIEKTTDQQKSLEERILENLPPSFVLSCFLLYFLIHC